MYALLIVVFIIISVLLVLSILFQSSKGDALSGTFGGQGGSILSNRGAATFLSKTSTILAAAFFIVTILISLLSAPSNPETESVIRKEADKRVAPAAGLPAPQGVQEEGTETEE
ncbi:MAG: preprotein translocase subunit SecG [Candidatus Marinimicrobia bacterium]|nr:preprotein translocase subunit SecG [Candidatus Neomarinimicrobiota bacterium]